MPKGVRPSKSSDARGHAADESHDVRVPETIDVAELRRRLGLSQRRFAARFGLDVTAIHNHGLMDMPRLFYMHFWATDDPAKLARGLKAALDNTNSQK